MSLRLSRYIDSPILFGVFHPTIVLPEDIGQWTTRAERKAIIEHELAHVDRRDALVTLFQNGLRIIFFFHPFVRYVCRQLSLEREMACDDRVVGAGAAAQVYAEGILKVAERSLTPDGVHQLALFSAREVLERRIDMILNRERVRLITRQWKYLLVPIGVIIVVAWLLIPAGSTGAAVARQSEQIGNPDPHLKELADRKAFNELIAIAIENPDENLRRVAAIQLTELEGDGSTHAMVELFHKTDDPVVKRMVINTFGRISEIVTAS